MWSAAVLAPALPGEASSPPVHRSLLGRDQRTHTTGETRTPLIGWCRRFFLRVRGQQARIQIHHHQPTLSAVHVRGSGPGRIPGVGASSSAGGVDRRQRGPTSAANVVINRDTVGSEATGPNTSRSPRRCAMSARQSPPIATDTARSNTILPGSWVARGLRHGANACDSSSSRPVFPRPATATLSPHATRSRFHRPLQTTTGTST